MSNNPKIKKKKFKDRYCEICHNRIYGIDRFCSDECKLKWKKPPEIKRNLNTGNSCIYKGCRSDLPIILEGRYCSEFCLTEQKRIVKKKNEEMEKRSKKLTKEIDKMTFKPEPIENETETRYQERVDHMKNDEFKIQFNHIIKEVDNMIFDVKIYKGPIEQASNLFGVADLPSFK